MELHLTADQEAFIRQGIEAGRFRGREDAVQEAMSLWVERERRRLEIVAAVDLAEASLARSGGVLDRGVQAAVVPITTLAPEPYEILRDIPAVVEAAGDGFIATFFDGNISTSGDTEVEAVSNLRSLILDIFEYLDGEPAGSLGPEPARQLAVLRVFFKRAS
jgi:Arc/MetJ-type ribon-helix-helix transcriptional regulator